MATEKRMIAEALKKYHDSKFTPGVYEHSIFGKAAMLLESDAEEVVHCCDCEHCIPWQQYADAEVILYCKKKRPAVVDPTDFCSKGERRTDNENHS